uniref:Uncharacterized protein n=1 Tax=Glossina brevipalpis TaxID=37001 RepID=A0A1A9WK15_9MUSC
MKVFHGVLNSILFIMEVRRAQSVTASSSRPPTGFKRKNFCSSFFNDALKDPVLIFITITVVIGSFCLLSGLFLLCLVSKTIQDETSEAILLIVQLIFKKEVLQILLNLWSFIAVKFINSQSVSM